MSSFYQTVFIRWIILLFMGTMLFVSLNDDRLIICNDYDNTRETLTYINMFNLSLSENKWRTFERVPGTSFWVYNYTFSGVCGQDENNNSAILIVGYTDTNSPSISVPVNCHIMYDGVTEFETVPANLDTGMYYKRRCLATYCWCPVQRNRTPLYVELEAEHKLKETGKKRIYIDNKIKCEGRLSNITRTLNKPRIGLCMEYNFNITSARTLAEYVEFHRLLGVEKAMMHGFGYVSKEVFKLIKYYYESGFLELLPWRNDNSIMHNRFFKADCLVRFRGQVDYVVFDDVDEFIIPSSENLPETIQGLIQYLKKKHQREDGEICSFSFKWTAFCVKDYIHHRNELTTITGEFKKRYQPIYTIKSIINVNLAYSINDHRTTKCRSGYNIQVDSNIAKVHHYRAHSPRGGYIQGARCGVVDNAAQRYQTRLLHRINFVIKESENQAKLKISQNFAK